MAITNPFQPIKGFIKEFPKIYDRFFCLNEYAIQWDNEYRYTDIDIENERILIHDPFGITPSELVYFSSHLEWIIDDIVDECKETFWDYKQNNQENWDWKLETLSARLTLLLNEIVNTHFDKYPVVFEKLSKLQELFKKDLKIVKETKCLGIKLDPKVTGGVTNHFSNFFKVLQKHEFVPKELDYDIFKEHIKYGKSKSNELIPWLGKRNELKFLIDKLAEYKLLPYKTRFAKAASSFCNKDGQPIKPHHIAQSKITSKVRKAQLKEALQNISHFS